MNTRWISLSVLLVFLASCGSFQAKRVDESEADEKSLSITDNWNSKDTSNSIAQVLKQLKSHKGYQRWAARNQGVPSLFIAEVQNNTSEAYFPIGDLNDELLNELSASGEFTLIDEAARARILKEVTYQNDGMVDPSTAKSIGKQTGADIMIFGNVYMKPESRDGKTIKQYSVNLRLTDIEKGIEVARMRTKVNKFSDKKAVGW